MIFQLLVSILIIGLFLFSKLLPYKDRLTGRYKTLFEFFFSFFTPILNFFKKGFKPAKVGTGLSVDMSQIILLILLLLLLNIF